jgi:hypothetical protein
MISAVILAANFFMVPASASHIDPKPNTVKSYYMNTVNQSILYDMGCSEGDKIEANDSDPNNALVILAFGHRPEKVDSNTWGAELYGGTVVTTTQIRNAVEEYADGLGHCIPAQQLSHVQVTVGVGVTNDFPVAWGDTNSHNHGDAWKTMVKNANDNLSSAVAGAVQIWGALDSELAWSSPSQARAWRDGWAAGPGSWPYINYGDAQSCAWFGTGDENSCGSGAFPGWNSGDLRYMSYSGGVNFPLPEIYRTDGITAEQWVLLSRWAGDHGFPYYDFLGPLSTTTGNTAADAWDDMVVKMDARPATIDDMSNSCYIQAH